MRPYSNLSDTGSESTMSSAFSSDSDQYDDTRYNNNASNAHNNNNNNTQQFFAKLVRDTRSKVEQKTLEINATMQEKLPEWKQRGAMYSNKAKETGIEWSRKGKEAVDRWKKERTDEHCPAQQTTSTTTRSENSIFGMTLEVAVALTKIDRDDLVPAVFRRCIEYLDDIGVHEVGIYRIPGSASTVNKLRSIFDKGSDMDFFTSKTDPHAVGTLLKMYLRELPEPIIPYELAHEYTEQFLKSIQLSKEGDKKSMEDSLNVNTSLSSAELPPISPDLLTTVKSITSKLPIYNFCLLQLLCKHLKKVADNEHENRMSISNLALIFIPTLNIGRALFHCMVEYYSQLFEGSHTPTITKKIPPPLPPKNKKIFHSKTMSDTDIMKGPVSKVPPPKPSRSPSVAQKCSSSSIKRIPPAIKPRSKSVSVPEHAARENMNDYDKIFWKQTGRVEAIGKQFETMMNSKSTSPPTSSSLKR